MRQLLILFVMGGVAGWQQSMTTVLRFRRKPARYPAAATFHDAAPEGVSIPCSMPLAQVIRIGERLEIPCGPGEEAYEFWVNVTVPGEKIQSDLRALLAESKKSAMFPGFRKGQVPPFVKQRMVTFAYQEAVNQGINDALKAAGLKVFDGDEAKAEVRSLCEGAQLFSFFLQQKNVLTHKGKNPGSW